jgi:hypothetical protein
MMSAFLDVGLREQRICGIQAHLSRPQPFLKTLRDRITSAAQVTNHEIDVAVRDLIEEGRRARQIFEKRREAPEAAAQNDCMTSIFSAPAAVSYKLSSGLARGAARRTRPRRRLD